MLWFSLKNVIRLNLNRFSSVASKPQNLFECHIDDKKIAVKPGTTIIQAADMLGIKIPRFCYHEKLSVAGNCRMCLVEVEKIPKPVAACALPVGNGMRIKTNSEMAKKAREGVMEFLLINHPLDCPICDQGGECDLQDQSMNFGSDRSRFIDNSFVGKRAVEDKDLGPLIKTIMTRCIHCTRCVRFAEEIAGEPVLGTVGRGNDIQIGTYVSRPILSELSGNIIDVCPVGALTSKPGEFTLRSWELKKVPSVDISDSVGSNINVCVRGGNILRIIPFINEEINEDWISDKARFSFDGLNNQRIVNPMLRNSDGMLQEIDWKKALFEFGTHWMRHTPDKVFGIVGNICDVEALVAMKDMFNNSNIDNLFLFDRQLPNIPTKNDFRSCYTMNNSIRNIENADVILVVGCCPRYEAPLINARIRKAWMHNCAKIGIIGEEIDVNYPTTHIGNSLKTVADIFNKKHPFYRALEDAKKPFILVGSNFSTNKYAHHFHQLLYHLSDKLQKQLDKDCTDALLDGPSWNVFNYLHQSSGYVGALDVGYLPLENIDSLKSAKLVYLMNCDSPVLLKKDIFDKDAFVIYQGHHGDIGASCANLVLPGASFLEKDSIYVNTEGRAQHLRKVVGPDGQAKTDWKIFRALSEVTGKTLPYDNFQVLRKRCEQLAPHLLRADSRETTLFSDVALKYNQISMECEMDSDKFVLKPAIGTLQQFYMTDVICKASPTMAKCANHIKNHKIRLPTAYL